MDFSESTRTQRTLGARHFFFDGLYHLYYCASTLGSNRTVIGPATTASLDPSDSDYEWVDRGIVLESQPTDSFNALDPSLLVDSSETVWLNFGSYWSGIKQRQIDPATGMLLTSNPTQYDLATRPGVQHNPIEGSVHRKTRQRLLSLCFC